MADTRNPSTVRREILVRWVELLDLTNTLEELVQRAPDGTFTVAEFHEAEMSLQHVWDALQNQRPRHAEPERPRQLHPLTERVTRRLKKGGAL